MDFNIQRLGLWLRYNQKSAISETEWEGLREPLPPELTGKLFAGIKYGIDGTNVALSIAARTTHDRIFVDAVDCQQIRNGNAWILSFLATADYDHLKAQVAELEEGIAKHSGNGAISSRTNRVRNIPLKHREEHGNTVRKEKR